MMARVLGLLARLVPFAVVLVAVTADAWGRPGGGQTYSTPGGGGGGGGGGDGDIAGLIIYLVIRHPAIGIPVALVAVGYALYAQRQRGKHPDWSTGGPGHARTGAPSFAGAAPRPTAMGGATVRDRLVALVRPKDPGFSLISFEDFLYALYARAHALRGAGQLEAVSAYVSPSAREAFDRGSEELERVETVVIGDMQIEEVRPPRPDDPFVTVAVGFEANYTEVAKDGREETYWVRERWQLRRHESAQTRPPEALSVEGCPSCGASLETHAQSGRCDYCGNQVDTGTFDWVVEQILPLARERRGPQLTGTVAERGTELPTRYDPTMPEALARLREKDPAVAPEALQARVELIFRRLNEAWTERDWEKARPFLSDALFRMQVAWMETYRRERLRNVLEDVRLGQLELVRVASDRWYDAITFRLFASGRDYTVRDDTNEVVSGDPRRPRAYSEYWTLIRRSDASGPPKADERCPSCGAGLAINMAGVCSYCDSKITSGHFDWVLSKIEQDESYRG